MIYIHELSKDYNYVFQTTSKSDIIFWKFCIIKIAFVTQKHLRPCFSKRKVSSTWFYHFVCSDSFLFIQSTSTVSHRAIYSTSANLAAITHAYTLYVWTNRCCNNAYLLFMLSLPISKLAKHWEQIHLHHEHIKIWCLYIYYASRL